MQIPCPQCGKLLEAPVPLPGLAQCPFCSATFTPTAVTLSPAAGGRPAWAEDSVRGPAIALFVFGIISLIVLLFSALFDVHNLVVGPQPLVLPPNFPINVPNELLNPSPTSLALRVLWDVLGAAASVVIIIGAHRMRQLQSYGLAVTASVLSMVPCLTCCCCIGIPLGLWAIVVLNRPEIRSSFQ